MAHGLTKTDKGVYKGAVWHMRQTDSTIVEEAMTAFEARDLAFPWNPILVKTHCRDGNGGFVEVPGTFQVVRDDLAHDDPRRFISCGRGVGRRFRMIDNTQIAEMMGALTNQGAHVVSAFSMFGGQRVVMVAQLGNDADVEDDAVRLYLIMTTAHDGTAALRLLVSPTRVVCWNTLSFAMDNHTQSISISHRKNAIQRLAEAESIIATCSESFGSQVDILRRLAQCRMTEDRAQDLLSEIISGKSSIADNRRERIWSLYNGEQIGAKGRAVSGTAFGMLSAVTQYAETELTVRGGTDALDIVRPDDDIRAKSVLFDGAGQKLRQKALDKSLVLLN